MHAETRDETLRIWLKMAKEIVAENDDCLLLSDAKLIDYINFKIREKDFTIPKTAGYILQHIYYNPSTSSTISHEMAMTTGAQLRTWWAHIHTLKELKLVGTLQKPNNTQWLKQKFLLERRFRSDWQEIKEETYNGPTEIKVTFSEDTSSDEADK